MKAIAILLIGFILIQTEAACSSCLLSSVVGAGVGSTHLSAGGGDGLHKHHYTRSQKLFLGNLQSTTKSALMYIALSQLSTHFGCSINQHQYRRSTPSLSVFPSSSSAVARRLRLQQTPFHHFLSSSSSTESDNKDQQKDVEETYDDNVSKGNSSQKKNVTAGMVGMIGIYKNFISPLLPPACRFLPTCSQYGVQAIEEFGPTKGSILTAWRLLRCSPFGGKGYDPPRWPPVSYTYSSY